MHVVHIDRQRSWTGQTLRVAFVARTLLERGHQVTVVAHPGGDFAVGCAEQGIPVIEAPMRGFALYPSILRVARALRGRPIDLIHCHGGRDHVLAFAVARLLRVPTVVRTKHNHTAPRGRRSVRAYDACDAIITVSDWVGRVLTDAGVRPEIVQTIPDTVDLERFVPRPRDPELMRSLGLAPDDVVIGNLSSLHVRKGIEDVLRAYARLRQTRGDPKLKCLLAGKQWEQWAPLARELGVEDGVVFPGHRSDVPEILSLFDVYVLMSRREALGTSVLEAMAMERAVVVGDVGGLTEAVVEGAGLRVAPGDLDAICAAVDGLLDDPERRRSLGETGRRHVVANYSSRRLADETMALYERLLRKAPGPA
ncbi:MAG: glycosyltransferase family 4 protein [Myxococcota bacterium]